MQHSDHSHIVPGKSAAQQGRRGAPEESHNVHEEDPQPQRNVLVSDPAGQGPQPPAVLLNAAEVGVQLCLGEIPGAAWATRHVSLDCVMTGS